MKLVLDLKFIFLFLINVPIFKQFKFFLFLFLSLEILSVEIGQKISVLDSEKDSYSLGRAVQILRTDNPSLKFSKIRKSEYFIENKSEIPNLGFTKDIIWARVQILNETNTSDWYLQIPYPLLEKLEFYYQTENGKWYKTSTGSAIPFHKRPISERSFIFPIRLEKSNIQTFYFKIETDGVMQFPIYIYSHETILQKQSKENFAIGIYYGILSVLIIYNFILFFILKDKGYFYYLLFILSSAIAQSILNGIAFQHFWPNTPVMSSKSVPIMSAMTLFFGLQFTRTFLNTDRLVPVLDKFLIGMMIGVCFFIFSPFFLSYQLNLFLIATTVILFVVLIIFVSSICVDRGYKPALYYLFAWGIFIIGIGLYSFKGFINGSESLLNEYGLQIGSTIEMIILSLGLASKIKNSYEDNLSLFEEFS